MAKINKFVVVGCAGMGVLAAMMAKRNVKATSIGRKGKTVTTADGEVYPYDKLIMATGGSAIVPPIPGVDLEGIFTLRTSRDAINIRDWVKEKKAKNAVVYGAGATGLEMAAVFTEKGLKVTMVVRSYIGRTVGLDTDVSSELQKHYDEKGVVIRSGEVIEKIMGEKAVEAVVLSSGDKIDADMIILSVGVRPNTELAIRAGWTALDLTTLRCAGQPELSPEPSAEPIAIAAEDAF